MTSCRPIRAEGSALSRPHPTRASHCSRMLWGSSRLPILALVHCAISQLLAPSGGLVATEPWLYPSVSVKFPPLPTFSTSRNRPIQCLKLRGGTDDAVPSSEDVEGEGTIQPGPGVKVEQGLVEKLKTAGEDEDGEMWQQIEEVEKALWPTLEDLIASQEEFERTHPNATAVPLNHVLFFEIRRGNRTRIKQLIAKGADPCARDKFGDCCIHLAAIDNHIAVLKDLVELGADVNAENDINNTALHIAAEFDQVEMIETLLELGANISARNSVEATPLLTAAVHDNPAAVALLAKHGADIHARSIKGSTPLHHAAGWGYIDTVRELIRLGAHVNASTPLGRTPMDWAHYSNHSLVKAELTMHGGVVLDGGMRPKLEIRKWKEEKLARVARREAGEAVETDPRAEPLIIAPVVRDPYQPGPVLKREDGKLLRTAEAEPDPLARERPGAAAGSAGRQGP